MPAPFHARAEEELGPVDILVNNAGSADTAPFMRSDPALFQRMIDVHLLAVVHTTQALLPGMLCTAPDGAASGQAVVLDGTQR